MTKTMTLERATQFGSAWNTRDPDLVASFFAEDGVYNASDRLAKRSSEKRNSKRRQRSSTVSPMCGSKT